MENKWEFERELLAMAVACTKLSPSTAKKKAASLFKKYQGIIEYSKDDIEDKRKKHERLCNMYDALKSGTISYVRGGASGKILLKSIEQVEVRESDILITTKSGREVAMGLGFRYLKELI